MKKAARIVIGFFTRVGEDHVGAYAAQAAYFTILSFIPCMILLMTVMKYTPITYSMVRDGISSVVPQNLQGLVLNIVAEVYTNSAAFIPISAVLTMWSSGKALQALLNGLNVIYHVKETRGWLANRLRAVIYTVLFLGSLLLSLTLLVLGRTIRKLASEYLPVLKKHIFQSGTTQTWALLLALFLVFTVMYRFLPNRKASILSQIPGALFATIAWYLFSLGFSIYFMLFPNISNTYGSLTTIILLMIWLDIVMLLLLYGAEINAYFEKEIASFKRRVFKRELRTASRHTVAELIDEDEEDEDEEEIEEIPAIGIMSDAIIEVPSEPADTEQEQEEGEITGNPGRPDPGGNMGLAAASSQTKLTEIQ